MFVECDWSLLLIVWLVEKFDDSNSHESSPYQGEEALERDAAHAGDLLDVFISTAGKIH
jgi:hypothetical protein